MIRNITLEPCPDGWILTAEDVQTCSPPTQGGGPDWEDVLHFKCLFLTEPFSRDSIGKRIGDKIDNLIRWQRPAHFQY